MTKKKKPVSTIKMCAACGDRAFGTRQTLPCCKDCLRLTVYKFESAVDELRRINREIRQASA